MKLTWLRASPQILDPVDGHAAERRQVEVPLRGKEPVQLELALVPLLDLVHVDDLPLLWFVHFLLFTLWISGLVALRLQELLIHCFR